MRTRRARILKRLIDVQVSAVALAAMAPVMAVTAIAIKRNLGSPVLFRQQRPGLNSEPFELIKFRTMRDTVDDNGDLLPDADRMTELSGLLRSASLDELPTLINVLKGDMSLVGPRPLLMDYLPRYSAEQARRHDVKPGVVGWAQINGRNSLTWKKKFEFDVWYVDNQSLLLDGKILILAVWKVLKRDGISHEGQATMHGFAGNDVPDPGSP